MLERVDRKNQVESRVGVVQPPADITFNEFNTRLVRRRVEDIDHVVGGNIEPGLLQDSRSQSVSAADFEESFAPIETGDFSDAPGPLGLVLLPALGDLPHLNGVASTHRQQILVAELPRIGPSDGKCRPHRECSQV